LDMTIRPPQQGHGRGVSGSGVSLTAGGAGTASNSREREPLAAYRCVARCGKFAPPDGARLVATIGCRSQRRSSAVNVRGAVGAARGAVREPVAVAEVGIGGATEVPRGAVDRPAGVSATGKIRSAVERAGRDVRVRSGRSCGNDEDRNGYYTVEHRSHPSG